MHIVRPLDVLKTCCFPEDCRLAESLRYLLSAELVPQLEAAGMTTAEWTRGALMLEEPHLSKVTGIVCRKCGDRECPRNPRFKPSDGLSDLMNGPYSDRIRKGDEIIARLLPEWRKRDLALFGVSSGASQMPSRKNPRLMFRFTRGGKTRRVECDVGTRRLSTNSGEETLLSLEQVRERFKDAIGALLAT